MHLQIYNQIIFMALNYTVYAGRSARLDDASLLRGFYDEEYGMGRRRKGLSGRSRGDRGHRSANRYAKNHIEKEGHKSEAHHANRSKPNEEGSADNVKKEVVGENKTTDNIHAKEDDKIAEEVPKEDKHTTKTSADGTNHAKSHGGKDADGHRPKDGATDISDDSQGAYINSDSNYDSDFMRYKQDLGKKHGYRYTGYSDDHPAHEYSSSGYHSDSEQRMASRFRAQSQQKKASPESNREELKKAASNSVNQYYERTGTSRPIIKSVKKPGYGLFGRKRAVADSDFMISDDDL